MRQRPHKVPVTLEKALTFIENNNVTSKARIVDTDKIIKPTIYFLDDDLLRAPRLRSDYNFPYLHKFLRLQRTTLTLWP